MSLSLDRMRYWLRSEMGGLDDTDLTDEDADELLNISLWDLESKFPFKTREQGFSASLIDGTYEYDISSITRFDAIASIAVIDDDGNRHKLARMTRDWLDSHFTGDEEGFPERYLREADVLTLYPVPNDTWTMELTGKQGVASLTSGSVEETGLPRNWDEIVVSGAVWRGHKSRGDYNNARQAANFWVGMIREAVPVEAKEEADSRYARLNVVWEFPEEDLQGYEES